MVYIDETGVDKKVYEYGWSHHSQLVTAKRSGKRCERVSIVAGLCKGALLGAYQFLGTCNTDIFVDWLTQVLLPKLGEGFVLVMDNARFHKSQRIVELIEAAKCRLLFLPPYSPDLNPIEQRWFPLKNNIRKTLRQSENLWEAVKKEI